MKELQVGTVCGIGEVTQHAILPVELGTFWYQIWVQDDSGQRSLMSLLRVCVCLAENWVENVLFIFLTLVGPTGFSGV